MTNKKYWLHRVSHQSEYSYDLLEEGYLTIGFKDIANESFYNTMTDESVSDDEKWNCLYKAFNDQWGTDLNRRRNSLWRFLEEFNEGDTVLVPKYKSFDLYTIVSKPLLLKKEKPGIPDEVDLGFTLKVEPIYKGISRSEYAKRDLTSRMKIRLVNADISDLKKEIEESATAFKKNRPLDLGNEIIEKQSEQFLNVLKDNLNPDKFEQLISWYLTKSGADVVSIPAKNDPNKVDGSDADVIAEFYQLSIVILVQAKLHDGVTDDWAVEQINKYDMFEQSQDTNDQSTSYLSWVISTCDSYSEQAIKKAADNNVRLIDGKEFVEMIMKIGIKGIE